MDEKETKKEIQPKRRKLETFLNVLLVLFSVVALTIAGVLIYQKRYLSAFWVNGQSMYPTLNKGATRPDGTFLGVDGGSATDGCDFLDYGVMDTHEGALKGLKRFDIVVCKYTFGDETDKIKRLVGMPGETIKFGHGDKNGQLFVKNGDQFYLVEQPIDNVYIASGSYPNGEIKLGNDEYFVLGDNRAHSSDSRPNRPIKFEFLVGKVVAICAYCKARAKEDGSLEAYDIRHFPPRFL